MVIFALQRAFQFQHNCVRVLAGEFSYRAVWLNYEHCNAWKAVNKNVSCIYVEKYGQGKAAYSFKILQK